MVRVIMGKKGSGKTKQMIELINSAVQTENGNVVCIEKGEKLTFDIHYQIRLVEAGQYDLSSYAALKGFVSGLYAGNYDITHIHVDETYPGMDTAVAALHAQGIRIAVLSNKREYMTKPIIEKLLPGLASPVVGRRADIPAKPDPTAALEL